MAVGWIVAGCVAANEAMPIVQFSIKPRLCVLSEGEEVCHDELEIKWIAENQRTLCLYQSDTGEELRCWESTYSGVHYVEINASENVNFYLKERADSPPVVSETFEVVQDNTKYRRRRRNAWNFF